MTTEPKNKGGRPPKPEAERRVHKNMRLLPRHWAKIELAGKPALEELLEAWQPKPPK